MFNVAVLTVDLLFSLVLSVKSMTTLVRTSASVPTTAAAVT